MASQGNLADLTMQIEKDPDSAAKRRTVTLVEGTIAASAGVSADDYARSKRKKALLCGLFAINALLMIFKKPRIGRKQIDEVNPAVASEESKIRICVRARSSTGIILRVLPIAMHGCPSTEITTSLPTSVNGTSMNVGNGLQGRSAPAQKRSAFVSRHDEAKPDDKTGGLWFARSKGDITCYKVCARDLKF